MISRQTILLLLSALFAGLVGGIVSSQFYLKRELDWVTLISIMVAAVAAIAALLTARATKNTVRARIVMDVTSEYASGRMLSAIRNVAHWQANREGEALKKAYSEEFKANKNNPEWKMDHDRRLISQHFYQIKLLNDAKVIDRRIVREVLAKENKIRLILDVIQWMEMAVAEVEGVEFDSDTFEFYRVLSEPRTFWDRVRDKLHSWF
jgi:hypothetical protein